MIPSGKRRGSNAGIDVPTSQSTSNLLSFPQASSPLGFQGFLTKSARWLGRTTSASTSKVAQPEARPRLSSSARRPTISGPSDPRPILTVPGANLGASQSVLDLSQPYGLERIDDQESPTPSELGDLATVSARSWSRSMDDLSSFSAGNGANHAAKSQIDKYRNAPHIQSPLKLSKPQPPVPFPSVSTQMSPTSPSSGQQNPSGVVQSPSSPSFTYRVTETTQPDPSQGVHVRSKSHGAHHPHATKPPLFIPASPPSNLRPQQDGPPQPRRANSNSQGEKEKDKPHSAFAGLSNFPFHFGASSSHKASGSASSSPFDTPTLQTSPKFDQNGTNAESADSGSPAAAVQEKPSRNSQIVHCAGFVNRFTLSSKFSAQGLSNEKSWKPYKAQLIGSKLYFYKPPPDRVSEIKSLFLTGPAPIEIAPKVVEPPLAEIPESGSRTRLRDRKRTYWGRARHSELLMDENGETIVGGSAEALIHEAVFATTFRPTTTDGKAQDNEHLTGPSRDAWETFSRAVMISLPVLSEKSKFEGELIRDVNSFDRGAAEEEKVAHRPRLEWLLSEYVNIHGKVDEEADWNALVAEQALDVKTAKQPPRVPYKPPMTPPARTGSPSPFGHSQYSPNGKLGSPLRPPVERGASSDSIGRSKLGALLAEEGLTREIFMRTDPRKVADSLAIYHRTQLRDILALNLLQPITGDSALANFCGTEEQPHWLTRVVMDMILGHVGKSTGQTDADTTEPGASASKAMSTAHVRAGVLTRWVQIGERCRVAGDICSWGAISAALCSVAVARLDKVWRRVDDTERAAVEAWVRIQLEELQAPDQHSPWIGTKQETILERLTSMIEELQTKEAPVSYKFGPMFALAKLVDDILHSWKACLEQTGPSKSSSTDVNALLIFWPKCSAEMSLRGASTNQMLSMSYAIESRRIGHYQPNFWKPAALHNSTQPIIPLLFPETLPTVSLLDRNTLLRSKKENLLGSTGVEVHEASVQKFAQAGRLHSQPPRNIAELDLEETLIPCFNGELILKMPTDDIKSRPISVVDTNPHLSIATTSLSAAAPSPGKAPSRGNSIRLSPAVRLERKSSQAKLSRRSSLPSISQRNSLVIPESAPSEIHIRVVIKRGTLDRLVDVLVSGLEAFGATHADDHGEMPLREGKGKTFEVDRAEYSSLWWNGFRSFVTPFVFFELLRKRYLAATTSKGSAPSRITFASTSEHRDLASNEQLCLDILSTLHVWLTSGGGTQDVLDDIELYQSFKTFLSSTASEPSSEIERTWAALRVCFTSLTSRPPLDVPLQSQEAEASTSAPRRFGSRPPNIDTIAPDELVRNLDSIAMTISRVVSAADLIELADILETQTADRTGWYGLRDYPASNDEQLPIQDLYGHLQMVEPSPFVSSSPHEHLVRLLCPSIRNVVRTHNAIRDWFIFKITEPNISPGVRLMRLEQLVNSLDACRSNAYDGDPLANADIRQPVVRSFVEAALVSAIVSPESRIFARSWNDISNSRGQPLDTLLSLIGDVRPRILPSKPLTVDLSWVMERLIEIITLPDLHDSEDGQTLINLDKRRFINNVIVNTAGSAKGSRMTDVERQDLERLSAMTREAHSTSHDFRAVRDTALREIAHVSLNQGRRLVKPFHHLVYQQQEKLKRDKYIRDRLLKEKKTEQLRTDKRASVLNKAMQPMQKSGSVVNKHMRQKRSVSGMYSLFRPLSVAFGGTMDKANSWEGPPRTAEELDFSTHSVKATTTLNMVGAGVRNFINDARPYTLQIDTEDGGHFLLQALGSTERDLWLNSMKKVADLSALKRLTYMGNNPLPELIDFSHAHGPDTPNGVFGHDILTVLKRESPTGEYVPGAIPRVVELCIAEIERRGITEVGIYRISGSKTLCNALRKQLDAGQVVDLTIDGDYPDIYVLADVLRQWFRELPESVFTNHLYNQFIEAIKIPDYDERKLQIRTLIWELPQPNFDVLRRLMDHLDQVVDFEDQNQMSPDAIAICFNVTLCRPPSLASFNNMQHTLALVKHCILHYHYTFSDSEHDPDADEVVVEEPSEIDPPTPNDWILPPIGDADTPVDGETSDYLGNWLQAGRTESSFVTAPNTPTQ